MERQAGRQRRRRKQASRTRAGERRGGRRGLGASAGPSSSLEPRAWTPVRVHAYTQTNINGKTSSERASAARPGGRGAAGRTQRVSCP